MFITYVCIPNMICMYSLVYIVGGHAILYVGMCSLAQLRYVVHQSKTLIY